MSELEPYLPQPPAPTGGRLASWVADFKGVAEVSAAIAEPSTPKRRYKQRAIIPLRTRVFSRVALPDDQGCMRWTGALNRGSPYAVATGREGSPALQPARFVYTELVGPIPDGVRVGRSCGNAACCAPDHMEALTFTERLLRGIGTPDENGCHPWLMSTNAGGYGRIGDGSRLVLAHRAAYEHHVGPILDDLVIDHLCRNRKCCNPAHLEPVTFAENVRRGHAHV